MSGIVLNYLHRLAFISMKHHLLNTNFKQVNDAAPADTNTFMQKSVSCRCCNWKGKVHEAQKNYFFTSTISEIEIFCPRCSTYIGFVSDENK